MRPHDLVVPFGGTFIGVSLQQGIVWTRGLPTWMPAWAIFVLGALGAYMTLWWHLTQRHLVERLRADLEKRTDRPTLLVITNEDENDD